MLCISGHARHVPEASVQPAVRLSQPARHAIVRLVPWFRKQVAVRAAIAFNLSMNSLCSQKFTVSGRSKQKAYTHTSAMQLGSLRLAPITCK